MRKVLLISMAIFIFAGFTFTQETDSETDIFNTIITHGQFAVKLTRVMKAKTPDEEIDEQSAIIFLETIGVKPTYEWNISASLTERELSDLVKVMGIMLSYTDPNTYVTIVKANYVLKRYAKMFREYYLVQYNADNSTDSAITDNGALTAPSLSPCEVE